MIRTAIALAKKGLAVFPCLPRAKEPATEHGCLDATTDQETIRQWWDERPDCNIGVACGTASGIFVVDIDGLDAELRCGGLRPSTAHSRRPWRALLRAGGICFLECRQRRSKTPSARLPLVSTRVPVALTSSCRRQFIRAAAPMRGASIARRPLLSARLAARQDHRTQPNGNGTSDTTLRMARADGRRRCRRPRDCTLTRITGYLLRRYIDPVFVLELVRLFNEARCPPPLPDEDVERIVNSIAGKELKRRQHG